MNYRSEHSVKPAGVGNLKFTKVYLMMYVEQKYSLDKYSA